MSSVTIQIAVGEKVVTLTIAEARQVHAALGEIFPAPNILTPLMPTQPIPPAGSPFPNPYAYPNPFKPKVTFGQHLEVQEVCANE